MLLDELVDVIKLSTGAELEMAVRATAGATYDPTAAAVARVGCHQTA
jgi:hypothetical protein